MIRTGLLAPAPSLSVDSLGLPWAAAVAALAGVLFAIPYLYASAYLLSWIAFVPWLLVSQQRSRPEHYALGLAFGMGCYVTGTYWVVDFLMLFKQYSGLQAVLWGLVFWLYSAHLPACLLVLFGWLRQRSGISDLILFPLLAVVVYAHFPMLFSAQLGESQSRFLLALQGLDRFGVSGLDAVIALVNVLLLRGFVMGKAWLRTPSNWLALAIVLAWFGYGAVSLQHWQQSLSGWPRLAVGLVQPNEPPSIKPVPVYPGYSRTYPPEMEMTKRLAAAGAELVIWPESAYKGYFDQAEVAAAFQSEVKKLGIPIMLQDIQKSASEGAMFNSVTLIDASGQQQQTYNKMKRVAFGEYVPWVSDVPLLRDWVQSFFGRFLNEIKAGAERIDFQHGDITLVPLICYETMFPVFVADSMRAGNGGRIIVAVSSNGWFGATRQPFQHIGAAVLRAVENRVSMVHAVNNGPSTAVTPDGRILLQTDFRQAGGYRVDVPYAPANPPAGNSWHPAGFLYFAYGMGCICLLSALWRRPCVRGGA